MKKWKKIYELYVIFNFSTHSSSLCFAEGIHSYACENDSIKNNQNVWLIVSLSSFQKQTLVQFLSSFVTQRKLSYVKKRLDIVKAKQELIWLICFLFFYNTEYTLPSYLFMLHMFYVMYSQTITTTDMVIRQYSLLMIHHNQIKCPTSLIEKKS